MTFLSAKTRSPSCKAITGRGLLASPRALSSRPKQVKTKAKAIPHHARMHPFRSHLTEISCGTKRSVGIYMTNDKAEETWGPLTGQLCRLWLQRVEHRGSGGGGVTLVIQITRACDGEDREELRIVGAL